MIKTWEELSKVPESETHYLDIDVNSCNGWVITKNPRSDKFSDRQKYLSTHTFYVKSYKYSTKLLQSCDLQEDKIKAEKSFTELYNKYSIYGKIEITNIKDFREMVQGYSELFQYWINTKGD